MSPCRRRARPKPGPSLSFEARGISAPATHLPGRRTCGERRRRGRTATARIRRSTCRTSVRPEHEARGSRSGQFTRTLRIGSMVRKLAPGDRGRLASRRAAMDCAVALEPAAVIYRPEYSSFDLPAPSAVGAPRQEGAADSGRRQRARDHHVADHASPPAPPRPRVEVAPRTPSAFGSSPEPRRRGRKLPRAGRGEGGAGRDRIGWAVRMRRSDAAPDAPSLKILRPSGDPICSERPPRPGRESLRPIGSAGVRGRGRRGLHSSAGG